MKFPVVVLVVSLIANAALLASFAVEPELIPVSFREGFRAGRATAAEKNTVSAPKSGALASPSKARATWAALQTSDLHELANRLRAAGFPPDVIRAIVAAEIDAQFRPRFRQIGAKIGGKEFWKPQTSPFAMDGVLTEFNALNRERNKAMRGALGDDATGNDRSGVGESRRYGALPKAKIELIQQVESDYSEMMQQVRAAAQGIQLPEDREKLALLEREKHADLANLLTPDELADYERRASPITSRLRTAMTLMDATDAEFRTVFDVQKQFEERLNPPMGGFMSREVMEDRRKAQAEMYDQLKTALGDARYADWVRSNDRDYQQLYNAAKRADVPVETVNQAFGVRQSVAAESMRIAEDKTMSPEDKNTALKTLGQNARIQLTTLLGPTAGNAYASNAGWLRAVEHGGAITLHEDGTYATRAVRASSTPNR